MSKLLVLLAPLAPTALADYSLGAQGESCAEHCVVTLKRVCDPHIVTNNSSDIFKTVGATCTPDSRSWWAGDQPSWVVDKADPNYGKCLGYMNVPAEVSCDGSHPAVRRICNCGGPVPAPTPAPPSSQPFFGTGMSGGTIQPYETELFKWTVDDGHYGVMTHFWMTAMEANVDGTVVRYYIDGEKKASIQFRPPLASGIALNASKDEQAPWGNKWIGKGAKDGALFHNFRIPFQSIRITIQHDSGKHGGMYFIVRGARDAPINIGGVEIPVKTHKARMVLQKIEDKVYDPVEYVPIVDVPAGKSGLLFLHTLAVKSGNLNFLEGCYHAYTPHDQAYPGTLISTGTEDYFDSAWYFNAGKFELPVAGFTHQVQETKDLLSWSGYRFHEMDPLAFSDGFRFVWRNGDRFDPVTRLKCFIEKDGGEINGHPTQSTVTSYAWVYVWDNKAEGTYSTVI